MIDVNKMNTPAIIIYGFIPESMHCLIKNKKKIQNTIEPLQKVIDIFQINGYPILDNKNNKKTQALYLLFDRIGANLYIPRVHKELHVLRQEFEFLTPRNDIEYQFVHFREFLANPNKFFIQLEELSENMIRNESHEQW